MVSSEQSQLFAFPPAMTMLVTVVDKRNGFLQRGPVVNGAGRCFRSSVRSGRI